MALENGFENFIDGNHPRTRSFSGAGRFGGDLSDDAASPIPEAASLSETLAAVKSIVTGPYLSGLTQFGSDGKATFGGSYTIDNNINNASFRSRSIYFAYV